MLRWPGWLRTGGARSEFGRAHVCVCPVDVFELLGRVRRRWQTGPAATTRAHSHQRSVGVCVFSLGRLRLITYKFVVSAARWRWCLVYFWRHGHRHAFRVGEAARCRGRCLFPDSSGEVRRRPSLAILRRFFYAFTMCFSFPRC